MEENIINKEDFEKFKEGLILFTQLKEPMTASKPVLVFSDYLKWCEIQRMDKLIKALEVKS